MRISVSMLAVLAVLFAAGPTRAAITFDRLSEGAARLLVVRGTFEFSDDSMALVSEVTGFRPTAVTFQSPGGNVVAAMKYGRTIRALGLATMQLRSTDCVSACTLAFLGGVQRFAEPGAIGVHQSSFASELGIDSQTAVSAVQSMTAEIMTYMIEMGVDPRLLQLSLAVDSSDMRYLTAGEMRLYRVTTEQGFDAPASQVASAPPATVSLPTTTTSNDGAIAFLRRYHAAWSSPNIAAMEFMRTAYADTVFYYGKLLSRTAIVKEKQAFAKRWPVRAYTMREDTAQVTCRTTCKIEAIVDWFARSDERGKTAKGAATISIEWDPRSGRIASERSKVLKLERSSTPKQLIAQWQGENGRCRGGPGDDDATLAACDRRNVLDAKLAKLNWCYGRKGEYGYQSQWHVCGPDSLR